MKKEAMIRLVRTERLANETDEKLRALGYGDTPYETIHGDIADAIYFLLDEHTPTFDESLTFRTLRNIALSDDQCADILLAAYNEKSGEEEVVSGHTLDYLKKVSEQRGVEMSALIKTILNEWVIRHELLFMK